MKNYLYRTKNKDIFYYIIKIDNNLIEIDFTLTQKNNFYSDIFIRDPKNKFDFLGLIKYDFNTNKFYTNKFNRKNLTNRQFDILKKQFKKIYMKILKIKYIDIFKNDFTPGTQKQFEQYENFRKYIDYMY